MNLVKHRQGVRVFPLSWPVSQTSQHSVSLFLFRELRGFFDDRCRLLHTAEKISFFPV